MITATELITQIERRLANEISNEALAAWAFDRFYELELSEDDPAEAEDGPIGEILDELMFADEPDFALSEVDLQRLLTRLRQL
jgi:hypothetical protein